MINGIFTKCMNFFYIKLVYISMSGLNNKVVYYEKLHPQKSTYTFVV